jgi:hypothetical protein
MFVAQPFVACVVSEDVHFVQLDCRRGSKNLVLPLKVHKIEIFFGFDFEICIISL